MCGRSHTSFLLVIRRGKLFFKYYFSFRYFKVLANGSYLAYYTEMPHTTPVSLR